MEPRVANQVATSIHPTCLPQRFFNLTWDGSSCARRSMGTNRSQEQRAFRARGRRACIAGRRRHQHLLSPNRICHDGVLGRREFCQGANPERTAWRRPLSMQFSIRNPRPRPRLRSSLVGLGRLPMPRDTLRRPRDPRRVAAKSDRQSSTARRG